MTIMPCRILFFICCLLANPLAAAAAGLAPSGAAWDVGEGLPFKKKVRLAVSGIACPPQPTAGTRCLLAADEGVVAPFIVLGEKAYIPDDTAISLLDSDGELDAEGAATDGDYFYVTGSHAVKRGDCTVNPNSRHVIRLRRDASTGGVLRNSNGDPANRVDQADLESALAGFPALSKAFGGCLGTDGGLDIEGLAVTADRLYFGFRGPASDGKATLLSVDKSAFFDGRPADPVLSEITVGAGRGIRDLQAIEGGLLVLAGPNDVPSTVGFTVNFWPASGDAVKLADLDFSGVKLKRRGKCEDEEVKPEALAVLEETPAHFRILILSDGLCDGGPMAFDVPR